MEPSDAPFDIPESWEWVTGSAVFNPMENTKPREGYFDYIDIDAIDNKRNIIAAPKHLLSKNAPSRATRQVSKGDVLFSMVRPYLKNIAKVDGNNYIASTGFYVCKPNKAMISDYCFYLMISNYVVNGLNRFMKGDNSPSINNNNIVSFNYPLPPLAEQQRIVAEIEKWFAVIDEMEASRQDLQEAIKLAKGKILDLAIHGKLVPQDPNDEPATELLKRINPAAKSISPFRKSADSPPYRKDKNKVPFEIPESWEFCCVEELFNLNPKNNVDDNKTAGFIPMELVSAGFVNAHTFEKRKWGEVKKGHCHFQNGDIGIAKISPCFENRKSTIFYGLPNNIGAGTTELVILRGQQICAEFYLYLFKSAWYINEGTKYFKGVVGQQRVNKEIFTTFLIPLPPLAEQKRIVRKIAELFSYLDEISAEI